MKKAVKLVQHKTKFERECSGSSDVDQSTEEGSNSDYIDEDNDWCPAKVTWIFASRLSQLHVNLKMVVVTRKKMILKMISTRKR